MRTRQRERHTAATLPAENSAGQLHVQAGQRFRQALDAIEDAPALAENVTHVLVGLRIKAQAEAGDALGSQFLDRLARIAAQVVGLGDIDVGRLAVGQQQQDLLVRAAMLEVCLLYTSRCV